MGGTQEWWGDGEFSGSRVCCAKIHGECTHWVKYFLTQHHTQAQGYTHLKGRPYDVELAFPEPESMGEQMAQGNPLHEGRGNKKVLSNNNNRHGFAGQGQWKRPIFIENAPVGISP